MSDTDIVKRLRQHLGTARCNLGDKADGARWLMDEAADVIEMLQTSLMLAAVDIEQLRGLLWTANYFIQAKPPVMLPPDIEIKAFKTAVEAALAKGDNK